MITGPEYRLLLAAASPDPAPASPADLAEIDWDLTLRLASDHRLRELLAHHLRGTGVQAPDPIAGELTAVRQRTAALELLAHRQLAGIARVLAGAGIRVVALKGAALIEQVYTEPGLRSMVDLDLLVAADEVDTAVRVLHNAGYRPMERPDLEQRSASATISGHHHHIPLVHTEHPFSVELHHRITDVCSATSTGRIVGRAQVGRDDALLLPHPHDQAISLAAHYSLDRQFGSSNALGQLADLAHTLARHPPNWTQLVEDAQRYELATRVFLALDALNTLELAQLPADALDALVPPGWSETLGRRMIAGRVLVGAPVASVAGGVPPSLRQALLPGREFMRARYGLPDASLPRLYLERARASARILASAAGRPRRFVADAALDRWLRRHADR